MIRSPPMYPGQLVPDLRSPRGEWGRCPKGWNRQDWKAIGAAKCVEEEEREKRESVRNTLGIPCMGQSGKEKLF